jgi:hypothetical protein
MVPSSRKSRSTVRPLLARLKPSAPKITAPRKLPASGCPSNLERPQDGAAARDDLDGQHAVGGRERGEVDIGDQLDLRAGGELRRRGVQRQRRVGGREPIGQRLGAIVAEHDAGPGSRPARGQWCRSSSAGTPRNAAGQVALHRLEAAPVRVADLARAAPGRLTLAAGDADPQLAEGRPRRSRRPPGRGWGRARPARGSMGRSGWGSPDSDSSSDVVEPSCATSSGEQASEMSRADAAARNRGVRFTANFSCGAHRSAGCHELGIDRQVAGNALTKERRAGPVAREPACVSPASRCPPGSDRRRCRGARTHERPRRARASRSRSAGAAPRPATRQWSPRRRPSGARRDARGRGPAPTWTRGRRGSCRGGRTRRAPPARRAVLEVGAAVGAEVDAGVAQALVVGAGSREDGLHALDQELGMLRASSASSRDPWRTRPPCSPVAGLDRSRDAWLPAGGRSSPHGGPVLRRGGIPGSRGTRAAGRGCALVLHSITFRC